MFGVTTISCYFLLLLLAVAGATTPTYCLCTQQFVYDPTGECGTSGNYNLDNVCFNCPVQNASGTFNFCGSQIFLGQGSCSQPGALSARQNACLGIGGNTGLTSFQCFLSSGSDKSQTSGCGTGVPPTIAPTSAPVSVPSNAPVIGGTPVAVTTTAPTTAPTSGGARIQSPPFALLFFVVVMAGLFVC